MSETDSETVFKRILWTVSDISKEKIEDLVGKIIDSQKFEVVFGDEVLKWSLWLFAYSDREESNLHLILVLNFKEANKKKFKIDYKFGIENKSKKLTILSGKGREMKIDEDFENNEFVVWTQLFDSIECFINDGKITLVCKLMISQHETETKEKPHLGFDIFFDEDFLADFELTTSDKKVLKAHKVVLASRSKVFHAMLKNDCKEAKGGVVEILDIDEKTMKEVLRFMYYGEVENLDELARDLIFAAEKYELDELKFKCIDSLIGSLTTENVLKFLVISDGISKAERFFEKCSDFIINNYETVSKNEEWKDLTIECAKKLMNQMMSRLSITSTIELK